MKFYIDLASRRFVKGPASSIPLERLFLKRRDKIDVEVIFVEKSAIVATPAGTSFSTGLKTAFSDTAFVALSNADGLLDLYTTALEALFSDDPASVSAFLEVKTSRPGEETRTSTLAVDIENSVILGDEGSPAAEVSLKATSADAISGTSNEKWMTPLRVSEAIAALGGGSGGTAVNWSTLTGKPTSFPPSSHTHPISEVSGLQTALNSKQAAGSYAAAMHTHDASAITSGTLSIDRIPVLPSQAPVLVNGLLASIPSSQESSIVTGTVVITSDGKRYVYKGTGAKTSADSYIILADIAPSWASISDKPLAFAPAAHAHLVADVAGLQGALDAKQPAGSYASAAQGAKADTASQPGHIHARADITGLDSALATKITGSGVADMQVVTALPASPSPTTFYIVIPTGATTATAVTLGSVSLLTSSGGGGGTAFTPTSISGLQLWLDASDESTLLDASGNAVAANSPVARWKDKSSAGNDFVQSVVNNQPTRATFNGLKTLAFDGANDGMSTAWDYFFTNISLFIVFRSSAIQYNRFFTLNDNSGFFDYNLPGNIIPLAGNSAGGIGAYVANTASYTAVVPYSANTMAIAGSFITPTSLTTKINAASATQAVSFAGKTLKKAQIGVINSFSDSINGNIAEVLFYNTALTSSQIQQVQSYLSTKWGIAL